MSEEYWILREGDLLPESTTTYDYLPEDFLDSLRKDGLLFVTKEGAEQVADILRNTVKSLMSKALMIERCECIHKSFEGLDESQLQDQPCASHQCRCNNSHSHKREHTLQISHGLDNEKTEGTSQKIEITIHL